MLTASISSVSLTTADVLQCVFSELRVGPAGGEECDIHVIPRGDKPRWIIVGNARSAWPVLSSWAPWKLSSRLRWRAVQMAVGLNLLTLLPGVANSRAAIDASYWRASLSFFPRNWNGVIHVGSFSHSRKAILFLIESGERVVCAAKVPLVAASAEAILNEGAMLDLFDCYDFLPKVLFRDCARGVVAQSWLEGKPVARGFTRAHLDLLSSLSGPGSGRVSDVRNETASGLDSSDLPFDRDVLARALEFLDCDVPLHRCVEHRDFAPWNLKWIRKGVLGLLDWEWAISDGLPWQDICRFFYIDDVHFQGAGRVWEALTSNELLLEYRRRFEIPPKVLPSLTMRYLLRELLMEWNGGNLWLAKYAFAQIRALIQTVSPVKL